MPIINMREAAAGHTEWRNAVMAAARAEMIRLGIPPLDGPLVPSMTFTLARPSSHFTSKGALSAEGKRHPRPDVKPDLSKLLRATEDALTDAKVWTDDARVVEFGRLAMVYPSEETDSLREAGAVIRVITLGELQAGSGGDAHCHPGEALQPRQGEGRLPFGLHQDRLST